MLLRRRSPSTPHRGFSRRRVALLLAVLVMLALMWLLRALSIAGFNGTAFEQMDWNGDGQATWAEILQGFYAVSVHEHAEAAGDHRRTCRRYAFLRTPDTPIRVDCRVEFGNQGISL